MNKAKHTNKRKKKPIKQTSNPNPKQVQQEYNKIQRFQIMHEFSSHIHILSILPEQNMFTFLFQYLYIFYLSKQSLVPSPLLLLLLFHRSQPLNLFIDTKH